MLAQYHSKIENVLKRNVTRSSRIQKNLKRDDARSNFNLFIKEKSPPILIENAIQGVYFPIHLVYI